MSTSCKYPPTFVLLICHVQDVPLYTLFRFFQLFSGELRQRGASKSSLEWWMKREGSLPSSVPIVSLSCWQPSVVLDSSFVDSVRTTLILHQKYKQQLTTDALRDHSGSSGVSSVVLLCIAGAPAVAGHLPSVDVLGPALRGPPETTSARRSQLLSFAALALWLQGAFRSYFMVQFEFSSSRHGIRVQRERAEEVSCTDGNNTTILALANLAASSGVNIT